MPEILNVEWLNEETDCSLFVISEECEMKHGNWWSLKRQLSANCRPLTAVWESEQVRLNCPEMLASCLLGIIDTASFRTQQSPPMSAGYKCGGKVFRNSCSWKLLKNFVFYVIYILTRYHKREWVCFMIRFVSVNIGLKTKVLKSFCSLDIVLIRRPAAQRVQIQK